MLVFGKFRIIYGTRKDKDPSLFTFDLPQLAFILGHLTTLSHLS